VVVTLKGPCTNFSSMGKVFLGLASRLRERFRCEIMATDNRVPDGGHPLPVDAVTHNRFFGVLVGEPTHLLQFPMRYKVLFTMYEASGLPSEWNLRLRGADEVWVPTTFCREVFDINRGLHGRESDTPRPRIVPIGYEETVYRREQWSHEDRERFWSRVCPDALGNRVVGTAGVIGPRKGIDLLLRAWNELAPEGAVLVVKSRDTRGEIGQGCHVIDADWTDSMMASFYRSCDLTVFPTRGEGFGLCPLESVACGTPALVTRASGPADYIDDRGVYGLDVAGLSEAQGMRAIGAHWYEPSLADLLQKLREWVYHAPAVEHQYRQWSMGGVADTWEREIRAAWGRATR
jgi:glycosyltransferase involved in cell wall biosynthesis